MKKIFTLLALLITTSISYSQIQDHKLIIDPSFSKYAKDHKIIAIIPFVTSINLKEKQSKKLKEGQLEKMEEAESMQVQQSIFSWLLKRKEKGKMWVNVQDVKTTNILLAKNGITYSNISEFTPVEIAKILKVDAIVRGFFKTKSPHSDVGSMVLSAGGFGGATNVSKINMFINNGQDGRILVNFIKTISGGVASSPEDLINTLMRKASRRIPYTNPKK